MRPLALLFLWSLVGCAESPGVDVPGAAYLPDAGPGADGAAPRADDDAAALPPGSDAAAPPPAGAAATYARLCAACHGPLGEGGAGPALTGLGDRDRATLADRIARTMPPTDPTACEGACADDLAGLILDTFSLDPGTCDAAGALPRRVRLLTRREYASSLRDLFFFDQVECQPARFTFDPGDRQPGTVHVAGSFNGWPGTLAAGGLAMARVDGVYVATADLPAGRHSYKFVLDERDWVPDPDNPLTEPDGFGGHNSIIEVPPCEAPPDPAAFTAGVPPETRPEGFAFETHVASGRVTAVHLEAYLENAERAARAALARGGRWLPCAAADAGCPARFATEVGARVFRRPLTEAEAARYTALARDEGQEAALTALLASPGFLYRSERGVPDGQGRYRLTGHEVAAALSYFLWGTTPDAELLAAAADGRLDTEAGLAAEARRLIADPRAGEALGTFAVQWLGVEALPTAAKSAELAPLFGDDVRQALLDQTRDFVRQVVFDPDDGRFASLLTAAWPVPDARLAALYGAPAGAPAPDGRAGVLGQASVLATYAHSDQSSPIRRGLFVRQKLLCQELPPPPPNAGGVPDVDPRATTRERFRQHTDDPFCRSCHQYIDAVGFGFEGFDAIGRHRTTENGQPIEGGGDMNDLEGLGAGTSAPYADLATLGALLAESEAAPACFATRLRRFALGAREGAADRCAVLALQRRFLASGGDLRDLLLAVVTAPEFTTRVEEAP
ncbi:MAG: DUF1592 domain-containing protein [Myxococcales bacterium]|nr:DUF1592 domain-containing protein [Myxococcales bacterium]